VRIQSGDARYQNAASPRTRRPEAAAMRRGCPANVRTKGRMLVFITIHFDPRRGMSREELPAWADELAASFRRAGADVVERPLHAGNGYLVEGRLIGHIELRPDALRVQLSLAEEKRAEFEARPTYDNRGSRPALHVITRVDLDYVLSLIPDAYRHARSGEVAAEAARGEGAGGGAPGVGAPVGEAPRGARPPGGETPRRRATPRGASAAGQRKGIRRTGR
jgi:hypothetical protein